MSGKRLVSKRVSARGCPTALENSRGRILKESTWYDTIVKFPCAAWTVTCVIPRGNVRFPITPFKNRAKHRGLFKLENPLWDDIYVSGINDNYESY